MRRGGRPRLDRSLNLLKRGTSGFTRSADESGSILTWQWARKPTDRCRFSSQESAIANVSAVHVGSFMKPGCSARRDYMRWNGRGIERREPTETWMSKQVQIIADFA